MYTFLTSHPALLVWNGKHRKKGIEFRGVQSKGQFSARIDFLISGTFCSVVAPRWKNGDSPKHDSRLPQIEQYSIFPPDVSGGLREAKPSQFHTHTAI